MAGGTVAGAQKPTYDVTLCMGQLNATQVEAAQGHFAIGQAASLFVRTGSVPHDLLKANNYSTGELIWRVRG